LISQACPDVRIAADLTISLVRLIRERNKAGFGSWIILQRKHVFLNGFAISRLAFCEIEMQLRPLWNSHGLMTTGRPNQSIEDAKASNVRSREYKTSGMPYGQCGMIIKSAE
jgi:hypothetical protein